MLRASILAALTAASACGPAPVAMPATRASELLERFAAGAADADVCTPGGRALLRGAVRAYGAAMDVSGVAWPSVPVSEETPDRLGAVDISVLVAFAAGFVEASDFRGASRAALTELSFAHWPEMRWMREGARVACAEVVALQTAAARVVMEMERLRFVEGAERVRRQQARLERAQVQMQAAAAVVEARLAAEREG